LYFHFGFCEQLLTFHFGFILWFKSLTRERERNRRQVVTAKKIFFLSATDRYPRALEVRFAVNALISHRFCILLVFVDMYFFWQDVGALLRSELLAYLSKITGKRTQRKRKRSPSPLLKGVEKVIEPETKLRASISHPKQLVNLDCLDEPIRTRMGQIGTGNQESKHGQWISQAFSEGLDRSWLEKESQDLDFDLRTYVPQAGEIVLYVFILLWILGWRMCLD
jgi:hypothetical protein